MHFQHHSSSSASVQKAQIWNNLYSCFPPKLSSHSILLDMGRSLSIPFLAVMCVITHLLPGDSTGCQEETGSSLSHAALSARSVWQNVSRTVDEETAEAFRGPWPSKESSPVPKTDWDWSKTGPHAAVPYVYLPAR